jgi:hypothetical protein
MRAVTLALMMVGSSASVHGQDNSDRNASARGLWVTESGYSYSVAGTCSDHYPSFSVGRLIDLGNSVAAGGVIFLGHNEDLVYGPMPRLRYRVGTEVGVDVAGGVLWGASRPRPSGYVSVSYRDLLGGFVQYERYRDGGCGQPTEDQVFLGLKVGSRQGIAAAVVGTAIAGIIIIAVISNI